MLPLKRKYVSERMRRSRQSYGRCISITLTAILIFASRAATTKRRDTAPRIDCGYNARRRQEAAARAETRDARFRDAKAASNTRHARHLAFVRKEDSR